MQPDCRVILVGMMGSGKTAVGRLLAERTGWPFHDNDELLLELFAGTPKEILASAGEARLREAESAALARGLGTAPPCIVSAPAGTILDPANRGLLRDAGIVIWLRASAETVERRAIGAAHRPWLDGGQAWITDALAERDPLYASVAHVVVETDTRPAVEVAREALERIGSFESCADQD